MTQQDDINRLNSAVFGNGQQGIKDRMATVEAILCSMEKSIDEIKSRTSRRRDVMLNTLMTIATCVATLVAVYNTLQTKKYIKRSDTINSSVSCLVDNHAQ